MKYNNIISESLRDYVRQSLITEEDSRIKGTKNAIKRCVAAIVKEDINSENVLNLSSEIWNYYVVKPIAGENRQLDEYIAIRNNSTILVKSVVKYDNSNDEFYVLKYKRLRDNFERLIQSQRMDNKSSVVDNEKGNINHWATNRQVEDLKASENTNNGRYNYTAYKIDDYGTPIEGLGMTIIELGRYTGGQGAVPLCYTQSESTYNSYTRDNTNTMYALLRDGWQDESCEMDETTYPLDSYGLSMIFVIVDDKNKVVYNNVRWNHGPKHYNRDVDHILSFTELNDIVGSSLMHKIGVQNEMDKSFSLTKEVESRLQQGESPSQIFDSFDEYNLRYSRLVRVKYKGMYNYITHNYDIFSDIWFDSAYSFRDGVAMVEINRLHNYLKEDGTFVYNKPIDEWLNYAFPFSDGLACVELDFKYNFMRKDGSMLLDKWYDNAVPFDDGYGTVCDDKKWNLVDTEGNFIWKEFKFVDCRILFPPNEFGCYNVSTTNGWNYLNKNLQPMSKEYFDNCLYMEELKNGFIIIRTVQRPYKYLGVDGILHDEPQDLTPIISNNSPSMLTEDRKQQIRSIRNKIRDVIIRKTSVLKNFDQSKIEQLVDDVWNKYVEHPNNGEKRQNDEITIINQNIQRFVPFVISTRDGSVEVVKTRKFSNCWENFIQVQKQNKGVDLLGDDNIVYWNAKNKYDEALKSVSNTEYEGSYHYTAYKIDDYDTPIEGLGMTVTELGKYTGGQGAVPLCYTQTQGTYNSYTDNNQNTMYALLRDGWKDEPCEMGDGYPLDSYGLSMIFVIVNNNGYIKNCNVRWNHGPRSYSRSVDNIFKYNELDKIVGSNIMKQIGSNYDVDNISLRLTFNVEQALAEGASIYDIVEDSFEWVEGFQMINYNDKYNFIDESEELLCDDWFDGGGDFKNGYACVRKDDKWNLIDRNGNFVWPYEDPNEWFDSTYDFENGFAKVTKNGMENLIRTDGTLVWNHENPRKWFDSVYISDDERDAVVYKKDATYILYRNGKLYERDDYGDYIEVIDFANNGKPIYADESTLIRESLKEYVAENYQMLVEGSTIKTIRNKIARSISAAIGADMNDDQVQRLTDDVWNTYVVAHNRQNREYTAINKNIERLIPYVLKKNSDHTYEIRKTSRIKNGFEALIQAQRENMEAQILDKHNNSLFSWYADKSYNDAVENAKKEVYEADNVYSAYKIEDYDIPIEGLGMTVKELGQYTGGENTAPLCYTQKEDTYNQFTNDNAYTMYALLREGWQDEPCEETEGYPYDSYGLSMIFVIIDTEDEIKFSNVRWNHGDHSYSKVDFMFTYQSLTKIVGSKIMNYICANHKFAVDYSLTLTKEFEEEKSNNNLNGRKYEIDTDEYDGYRIIRRRVYGDSLTYYNYVDSNLDLLTHRWFYSAYRFDNGCAVVRSLSNQKYNIIRTDGTFVWDKPEDEWFTYAFIYYGRTDYILVRDENRNYNLLTQDGHLFLDKWVQAIEPFDSNDVARIRIDNKLNYIRTDKTFVWDKPHNEWFDGLDRDKFQNGIAKVFIDGNPFYLDLNGNLYKTPPQNSSLMESIKKNFLLLTEDQERTIRNKIARGVATITQKDVASQDVQSMTDEIWNVYVKHPIEGEKRQNDEVWAINTVISRLIPYVVKQNEEGNFFVNKNSRIKDAFENLIQAQRREQQSKKQLWNNDESLTYWNVNRKYNDAIDVVNQKQTVGKYNYSVYKVDGYDTPIEGLGMTVKQLGEYTGGQGAVPLCYTQTEGTYNSYTRYNKDTMYALLRDGWQDEPCEIGEDYPLDSYGLSMIFVIVDTTGALRFNNVRWNHGPKGYPRQVDNIFSYQELCEIVGSNVIRQIGIISYDEIDKSLRLTHYVEQKLKEKVPLYDIFSDYNKVFGIDCYRVKLDDLQNILDTQGDLLSDYWFENVTYWGEGIFRVANNHKYNFILPNGSFVIDNKDTSQWFEFVGSFYYSNSAFIVELNGKYNYIRYDGEYLWDKPWEEWFDNAYSFDDKDGLLFAFVYKKSEIDDTQKANILLMDGTLMFNEWVGEDDFHEDEDGDEVCQVTKNGKYNLLNISGYLKYNNFMDFDEFKKVYPKAVLRQ